MKPLLVAAAFALLTCPAIAQTARTPPALAAITEKDLKADLYELAGDHFRGREAGTLDELKVSVWWADKLRALGLKPAGEDGTYFQFFNLKRHRIAASTSVRIGERPMELWKDVLIPQTAPANLSAPIIFLTSTAKADLDKLDLKGKAVALNVSKAGIDLNVSLPDRRYPGFVLRKYSPDLLERGATAIIFIADTTAENSWRHVAPQMSRGLYDIEGGVSATVVAKAPVFWLHTNAAALVQTPGAVLTADINIETFDYPSVNLVAAVEGTDPVLKKEYVLYSGHNDHDGIRQPFGTDSIYNGADDNASVSVAMLAIARAFKKNPGKRSVLFVFHGAEERGLLGSRWYAAHLTIPKTSLVAVLNGDMIGCNDPDSSALLGMQVPHRNSKELVDIALQANNAGPKFKLDTLWDKPEHPEGFYFRSDHLPYARLGYPAIYYTATLHPLYHTPMDEPKIINIPKLKKMTEWMYRTGWTVANNARKPALDPAAKLER